jgi:heme-degrading monooxygenase HmoA
MIARIWQGATKAEDADTYFDYVHQTGLTQYRATPGNLGVLALRRVVDGRAELLLLTLWESEEAIRRFAGDDIGHAVFYPEDERFLVEKEDRVSHYEVVFDEGLATGVGTAP